MIEIPEISDEKHKKGEDQATKAIATDLDESNNVSFDGEKIKFTEVEFANPQEALRYIKAQENLLLKKNREKNENVVKEVGEILDNVEKKGFLDKYGCFSYQKRIIQEIKDFLKNYEGDLSNFMNEVAEEWKARLQPHVGYGNAHQYFLRKWNLTKEMFDQLEGEELIKALKKEADSIDKLPKATASNLTSEDLGTANFIYYIFMEIYEKYKKQQASFE